MSMIDEIRRDREAGTPGPWRIMDADSIGDRCTYYYQEVWNEDTTILVTTEVTRAHGDGGKANIRRCARVPDMEAALLAAEYLATAAEKLHARDHPFTEHGMHKRRLENALAAYRKATGADQ